MNKSGFKGWQRVLLIIIPWIIVMGISQVIGLAISGGKIMAPGAELSLYQEVIMMAVTLIGSALLIWLFRSKIDRASFVSLGFQLKKRGRDILLGLLIGLLMMGLGFGLLILLKKISIDHISFNATDFALSFLLFVLVAFNEEIFLRGYVLNNLMLSMNRYLALFISAIAFSLLHLFNPHFSTLTFFVILLSGIILGISYIYTRNLWFPIALHFSWNFFQGTVFGFNVSGQDVYSVIDQRRPYDDLINGGAFGFEGSLLSIVFILLFTVLAWRIYRTPEPPDNAEMV